MYFGQLSYYVESVNLTPDLYRYILQYNWNCFTITKLRHRLFISYLLVVLQKSVAEICQTRHCCMCILPRGKDKVKDLGPQTCFDFQLATDWVEKSPRPKKCSLAYSEREKKTGCNRKQARVREWILRLSEVNPDCIALEISSNTLIVPMAINTSTPSLLTMCQAQALDTCNFFLICLTILRMAGTILFNL